MPNNETFETIDSAKDAVDLLYDNGLMITDDYLESVRNLFVQPSEAGA